MSDEVVSTLVAVRLERRFWNGDVTREDIAREVENSHNSGRVVSAKVKHLTERFGKPITDAYSKIYTYFRENTLPWEDGGWRIIPAAKYQELQDKIAEMKLACDEATEHLTSNYDEAEADAKAELNGLFVGFPSYSDLCNKYGIEFFRKPIQRTTDARIAGLSEDQNEALRQSMKRDYENRIHGAIRDIIDRLGDQVRDLHSRLKKEDQDGVKYGGWSKVTARICDSVSGLNITGDPKIVALIDGVKKMAREIDGDSLRVSDKTREDVKGKVENILSDIDNFGA